jgi:hypothetical protein
MVLMSEERFNRVSRAAAVVVLAAAGLFCCVRAGETVRFSDSKQSPVIPEGGKKDRSSSFGGLLDRDSSLGGVTAVPFSGLYGPSSKSAAKSLTVRERDLLDQRNNWIQLTPDDLALTEKSASKAFGVRDYSLENLQDQHQQRKGDLQRYMDRMDEKSRKEQDKAQADAPDKGSSSLFGGGLANPDEGASSRQGTESSRVRESTGLRFSDVGISMRQDDKWFGRKPDSLPDSLVKGKMFDLSKGGFRSLGLNRFQPSRADDLPKTPAADLGANSLANPLGGALDPVNFHPDLTRQQLNPVVGQPINQANQAGALNFSESLRPLGPAAQFMLPGVVNGLNLGAVGIPAIAPTPTLLVQPQKAKFSPAMFEIPKRPY